MGSAFSLYYEQFSENRRVLFKWNLLLQIIPAVITKLKFYRQIFVQFPRISYI